MPNPRKRAPSRAPSKLDAIAKSELAYATSVRASVAGVAHIHHADGELDEALVPMRALMTQWAWGKVWSREGLDRRTRIYMNLGMLMALNRPNELRMAIRIALRNRFTHAQIGEAILHAAVYCGIPAASSALLIASEEFKTIDRRRKSPSRSAASAAKSPPSRKKVLPGK